MNELLEATAAAPEETMTTASDVADEPLIEADELVEEVSIDGMCGVY
ncbi:MULTISPECIES: mycofactocin precursor MftA [unclassified Streptomyces]|nr:MULTISPECIES: mycofactocin precursor MftA [unclassified Streptomyces]